MKQLFIALLLLIPAMIFAGCSEDHDTPQTETPGHPGDDDDDPGTVTPGTGKILIAYFSRWGNTNYSADVDPIRTSSDAKSESRTYFFDKMRERLNLRMQRDDKKERERRR